MGTLRFKTQFPPSLLYVINVIPIPLAVTVSVKRKLRYLGDNVNFKDFTQVPSSFIRITGRYNSSGLETVKNTLEQCNQGNIFLLEW